MALLPNPVFQQHRLQAKVIINIVDDSTTCVRFPETLYEFVVNEDVLPGIVIGSIAATADVPFHLQLVASNSSNYFHIDSINGKLSIARDIREEHEEHVLLNIEVCLTSQNT